MPPKHGDVQKGTRARFEVEGLLPNIQGDKVRLEQVICNLLGNASKFGDQGGRIALTAVRKCEHACICVEDDGRGIAPELLPRVFDVFEQGDASLDRAEGGLGIGLALVKSLVQLHGGKVQAESQGKGRGSRFTVWILSLMFRQAD